jgi:hypothetical protein
MRMMVVIVVMMVVVVMIVIMPVQGQRAARATAKQGTILGR